MSRKVLLRIAVTILVLLVVFLFYHASIQKDKISESGSRPTDFTSQPADNRSSDGSNDDPQSQGSHAVVFGSTRTAVQCAPPPKIDSTARANQ